MYHYCSTSTGECQCQWRYRDEMCALLLPTGLLSWRCATHTDARVDLIRLPRAVYLFNLELDLPLHSVLRKNTPS